MSHRTEQIESTLLRAIAQALQRRVADPRIRGMVSVTRVKVSPDLHDAQVYISVLPDQYQNTTLQGLRHASRHVQSLVREQVAMRSVPELDFRLDEGLKKQEKIYEAIHRGMERVEEKPSDDAGEEGADDE